MERSRVELGMEALAPAWVFASEKSQYGDTSPVRVRVARVAKRWRSDPSVVEIVAEDGRETAINVYYLEPIPKETEDG